MTMVCKYVLGSDPASYQYMSVFDILGYLKPISATSYENQGSEAEFV